MDLRWPLVGRGAELEQVRRFLRDGQRGVLLAGPAGVGKTRLAGECLSLASTMGFVPLRITATQGAAGLPFGAYASIIPTLVDGAGRSEVLGQVAAAVVGRGEGRPVALFVDDAHLLDDASAALTHLLVDGDAPVFLLATVRSSEPAPDAVVAVWKDGLTERLELEPLGPAEFGELLARALAGPVDGATGQLLWERTEGNVLFLREVVLAALADGSLHKESGSWRLSGSPALSPRLVEIVEARLGEMSDAVRRALAIVALGEPLGVDVFGQIDQGDLEDLERRGLVVVERLGRRLDVRLAHPLYGEVVRARVSPLRARSTARVVADAVEATGARRREDTLRVATLRLDGAGSLDAELMLRAATIARQRFDLPLAARLAGAALQAGAGFEAGMLLGQLSWWQGRAEEADRQLSALTGLATEDSQRAALATARMDVLGFGLNRNAEALRIADEAEAAIGDPISRDRVIAYRARGLGWAGESSAAVATAEPLLGRATGPTLIAACMAAATHMSLAGRTTEAIEATRRGHAAHLALTGPPLTWSPGFHLYTRCLALNTAGRLAEAEVLGRAEYARAIEAGSIEGRACFSMVLAATHLAQGRLATAVRVGSDSAADCRQVGWPLTIRMPLIYLAWAWAVQGQADRARSVLAEIDRLGVPAGHMLGPDLLRARAWTEVAGGAPSDGHAHLREAAAMARAGGALALEAGALHDLARLGEAGPVRARMEVLGGTLDGPAFPAAARHVAALVERDASGLAEASIAFEAHGALLLAAEAAADSAVAWRRALEPRKATAAEQRAAALAAGCEGARTPTLTAAAPARAVLTARELEIARLAAKGLANREIAERLFLSHRTVENKLHTCYAKLGADGRADLERALECY